MAGYSEKIPISSHPDATHREATTENDIEKDNIILDK